MAFMSFKNLTIGIWDDGINIKIDFINKKINGIMGKFFERLFIHKNKRDSNLKSIEYSADESSLDNDVFFNSIKNNSVDLYYLPFGYDYFTRTKKYLEHTKITNVEPYRLGQFLPKPTKFQQTDLSSFLFNNLNSLLIILIGYLLIGLIYFMFTKLIDFKRIKILKIKFYNLLYLNHDQLCFLSFKFGLLNLFFNLFLFINLNLLTNTIKTDKVTINTDEFLNTDYKLLETNKRFVFRSDDGEKYRMSSKINLLNKLYQKKVNFENNYSIIHSKKMTKDLNLLINNLSSFFMIGLKTSNLFYFSMLLQYSESKEFIYLNNKNYFEVHLIYYLRKSLNKEIKKMLHWSTNQYFENGIYMEFEDNLVDEISKFIIDRNVPIILNLNDYISEQTIIASFNLENFRTIFNFYILILFVIWVMFIISSFYFKFAQNKNRVSLRVCNRVTRVLLELNAKAKILIHE